jgi:hypothetical protein
MPNKNNEDEKNLYKRGNKFWFFYSQNGLQLHKSTKTADKLLAIKIKNEFISNLNKPIETRNVYLLIKLSRVQFPPRSPVKSILYKIIYYKSQMFL